MSDPTLATDISTLSGQLEFTGVISHYESETSSYFSALGVEPLPALKLGSFDKIIAGSDLSRVKGDEITLGSGLAKTLNAKYDDWLDVMVVNTAGGQGALSLKLRGIFESGIKDYDDVAMKIPLDTAQRMMGTDGVSKVLILLKKMTPRRLAQSCVNLSNAIICRWWSKTGVMFHSFINRLKGCYRGSISSSS